MTANPSIFPDARSPIQNITYVLDDPSGTYTAFYDDLPGLVVQAKDKQQARERLKDLLIMYIKSICKK